MAGIADVGRLVATLGLNTTPFMTSAKGAMSTMQALNVQMMMIGRTMTRFVTLPMAIAGVGAVKMEKDFEMSMTKIVSLVGVARDQVNAWKEDIFNIAKETGRGPNELAEAMYFVTSAGYRGAEALDILHKSARAAAGGLGETKDIADLVTSAMYAYRKSNLSATEALDIAIATVREGKVEVTDLINTMGKVFPVSAAFGVSMAEVGASLAAMTRSGTEADKASTHLRAILNQMMSPSEKVRQQLSGLAMGADEFQKTLQEKGLIVALQDLNKAIKGDPRAYAEIFQNIRALTGVLDIMGDNMDENVRIFERMKNANGELKKVFEEVQGTTQNKLDKALANLGVTAIKLGEILKDPVIKILEGVSKKLSKLAEWFDGMTEAQKRATMSMGLFVMAAGPVLVIISRLSMMLGALGGTLGGIAVLAAAAALAFNKYNQVLKGTSMLAELEGNIKRSTNMLYDQETSKIKTLYKTVMDEATSKERRVEAMKEMKRLAPGYFGDLDTEKGKVEGLTGAYEDYMRGMLLKSKFDAINQEMTRVRQSIVEAQNTTPGADMNILDKAEKRYGVFANNFMRMTDRIGNFTLREKLKYNQVVENLHNQDIAEQQRYLKVLEDDLVKAFKMYNEHEEMMLAARKNSGGDDDDDGTAGTGTAIGGYLFQLQQDLRKEQENSLSVSKAAFPAQMDLVRAAERKLALAQLEGNEWGYMADLQNKITRAQLQQTTASKADWILMQEKINGWQEMSEKAQLMVDGFGALEKIGWDIAMVEKEMQNAGAERLAQLNEELRLLYMKEDILRQINDPYKEQQLLAEKGTRAWKDHYASRLQDLNHWLNTEQVTNDTYLQWQQERYDIEKMFGDYRREQAANYLGVMQNVIGSIQTAIQQQYDAELRAAGDNTRKRAKLEKEYQEKLKRWALVQAAIQTALAVIKSLPNVALAAAVGAAGLIEMGVMNSQTFAKGGIVYGETLATVGEYPGASSNPEVIAPLSDLKRLLGNGMMGEGGEVEFKVRGEDLWAVLKTQELLRKTY